MNWIEGRQGSGYLKKKIFESKLFKFDMYLIKFPEGSYITTHVDPSPKGYSHHRLNIILKRAKLGGTFFSIPRHCAGFFPDFNRVIKFRPDQQKHSVSKIQIGSRYVLSFGWLTKKKYKGEY